MAIPIIPNPIPQWTGATGGDIAGAFMSAFQASNNMRLQNQQDARQAEQFQFEKSLWPLKKQQAELGIEAQKLGMDETRQNMGFAAEDQQFQRDDQAWQAQQRQHELDVLRPIKEASARNRLTSTAYELEGKRQKFDANTAMMGAQMTASRAIEDALAGLSGFGQNLKSAPAEMNFSGKVTSYGYQSDPLGDSASLGKGAFKKPTGAWGNELSADSLAVSPDVERSFKAAGIKEGDYVNLRLANGSVVRRKWDDRTMQDEDATKKFGKPLTGRFDFYSPDGVSKLDGNQVVGFSRAGAANPVAGMNAGPVTPDQVGEALRKFDTLVNTSKMLPPSDPARIRAEIGISTAINDPTFSGILQQREIQKQNVAQGAAVANNILSMPVDATASFKARFPQFSDVVVVPTTGGGYDIGRKTQAGVMPMSLPEKVAFNTAYEGFAKKYKEDGPDEISATTLRDYTRQVQILAASKKLPPDDRSDAAEKVRMQALGAEEAINVMEQLNPALRGWRQSISPETMPGQQQGDGVAAPAKKPIPKPGQQQAKQAKQDTALLQAKAVDAVDPKLRVLAPDNGKKDDAPDGLPNNPALRLAISIWHDEKVPRSREDLSMATSGIQDWIDPQASAPLVVGEKLREAGLNPEDEAATGITNFAAAKLWAKKVLDKYDYDTSGGSFEEKPAEYKAAFSGVMSKVGAAPAQ